VQKMQSHREIDGVIGDRKSVCWMPIHRSHGRPIMASFVEDLLCF
jgi:hypothetical protein